MSDLVESLCVLLVMWSKLKSTERSSEAVSPSCQFILFLIVNLSGAVEAESSRFRSTKGEGDQSTRGHRSRRRDGETIAGRNDPFRTDQRQCTHQEPAVTYLVFKL